jgi:hypothetical protein
MLARDERSSLFLPNEEKEFYDIESWRQGPIGALQVDHSGTRRQQIRPHQNFWLKFKLFYLSDNGISIRTCLQNVSECCLI